MAVKKCLNFDFDSFIDIGRQIAFKRFIHKKYWNVVLHAITSVFVVWCGFYLLSCFLPYFLTHVNLFIVLGLCIAQDLHLGLASCLIYPVLYYHALYVTTWTFLQVCSLATLSYIVENFVGQQWIECVDQITMNTCVLLFWNFFMEFQQTSIILLGWALAGVSTPVFLVVYYFN